MKRFHISVAVSDFAASVADYSKRLGAPPDVAAENRYALWRTPLLNFSISCKPDQPAGLVRHIGFEDSAEPAFREETDVNGITWEYFSQEAQAKEIAEKIPEARYRETFPPAPAAKNDSRAVCRLLTLEDAALFHSVRLRAVREEPGAFLESAEEVAAINAGSFGRYLENGWIAGAFIGDALCGMAGLYRHKGSKTRHKGTVWGVYVAPEARGMGCARQMIELVIEQAQAAGIELLMLSTDAQNPVSISLYLSLGFTPCGVEKHILKLADRYVDDMVMMRFL